MNIITFIVLLLATWRVSNLLADEKGPGDILEKLRYKLGVRYPPEPPFEQYGTNVISKGIICVWCNSVWVGTFWTIVYTLYQPLWIIALPFALSAGAVVVNEVLTKGE